MVTCRAYDVASDTWTVLDSFAATGAPYYTVQLSVNNFAVFGKCLSPTACFKEELPQLTPMSISAPGSATGVQFDGTSGTFTAYPSEPTWISTSDFTNQACVVTIPGTTMVLSIGNDAMPVSFFNIV